MYDLILEALYDDPRTGLAAQSFTPMRYSLDIALNMLDCYLGKVP
jgi:hypothetical protein